MLLETLLREYKPPYPTGIDNLSWFDTFSYINSTPSESQVVYFLIKDFLENGKFREPIILSPPYPGEEPEVCNGVHRITALYNMCEWNYDIDTQIGFSYPNMDEHYIEFTAIYDKSSDQDKIITTIADMSYPLDSQSWIQFDVVSSVKKDDQIEAHFSLDFGKDKNKKYSKMIESLEPKLEEAGNLIGLSHTILPVSDLYN